MILVAWCVIQVLAVALLLQVDLPTFDLFGATIDLNLPKDKSPFDVITDFAMFGALSFETTAVASIFLFRRRFPKNKVPLPYRCPLYPFLPAVYVLVLFSVLANMFVKQRTESLTAVGFILIGSLVYLLFLRHPGKSENLADKVSPNP